MISAAAPPERRGLRRDQVRLLVLDPDTGRICHSRFDRLGTFLRPGDLLVLNNSRTLPAVIRGEAGAGPVEARLARPAGPDAWWVYLAVPELPVDGQRGPGARPSPPPPPGARLRFPDGLGADVLAHPHDQPLTLVRFSRSGRDLYDTLYRIGEPVRYKYVSRPWGLDDYQTVYASAPGSVEMPSAGRPFTWELLQTLKRQGIGVAFVSLHAGLSYYDDHYQVEPDRTPEEYVIPGETAAAVAFARAAGGRVIAVGTTVVRALETAAAETGTVRPGAGWTTAYIRSGDRLRAVSGLLTGLHEPEASHLDMLAAFALADRLQKAYSEAAERGYLWHEFGDAHLILPMSGNGQASG